MLLNIKTITEYNDSLGLETLHPLVAVVNLSKAKPMKHAKRVFSFYTVFYTRQSFLFGCSIEKIIVQQMFETGQYILIVLCPGNELAFIKTQAIIKQRFNMIDNKTPA